MISFANLHYLENNKIVADVSDAKFKVRGQTMYVWKLTEIVDILTKDELKTLMTIFDDTHNVSKGNILLKPFKDMTPDMKVVQRSRFKKKLLENGIILEHLGKIMINPYILVPRNDKNVPNWQYSVQRLYRYLAEDKNAYFDGMEKLEDYIFNNKEWK